MNGIARKACPVCGGQITVGWYYQFSREYQVLKSGKLSKRYTRTDEGPMEVSYAACLDCGAFWEDDDFDIDDDRRFIDRKYKEEE